jgi:hypothetical protein
MIQPRRLRMPDKRDASTGMVGPPGEDTPTNDVPVGGG